MSVVIGSGATSKISLGELQPADVRDLWPHEEYDFTPWLALPENLERLSEAVGLELEIEAIEKSCGPYSCDILARESGSDRYVIIENQFRKTNHDHLGKLITYASSLDAGTIIWISEAFSDEHQKALDWLNDHTTDDVSFYGVALELWQIDDSRPAVKFNVVSRPIRTTTLTPPPTSGTKIQQLEFWNAVRDKLLADGVLSSAQTPKARYWYNVRIGRSNVHISNIVSINDKRMGVGLYIRNKISDVLLAALAPQRAEIEQAIGHQLDWNPFPNKRDKLIRLYHDADLDKKANWPDYVAWMVETIRKFRTVFGPRLKDLDLSQTDEAPEEEFMDSWESGQQERPYVKLSANDSANAGTS